MAIFVGVHRGLCLGNLCKGIQQFGIDSAVFKCTDKQERRAARKWSEETVTLS